MTYAFLWPLCQNREANGLQGEIFKFGAAPDLRTSPWAKVLCFPVSAPAGRIGECVHFCKNFSKWRFYDGSSLLPREW